MSKADVFMRLVGVPGFRAYLEDEYAKTCDTMAQMVDEAQLRMAQGRAQMLKQLLRDLEAYGSKSR